MMKSMDDQTTNSKITAKSIQQAAFKNWINAHIKSIGKAIDNLQDDIVDGSVLIDLVEIVSQKRIRKFADDAVSREDKLANVRILFLFLKGEHLVLDSIGIMRKKIEFVSISFTVHTLFLSFF